MSDLTLNRKKSRLIPSSYNKPSLILNADINTKLSNINQATYDNFKDTSYDFDFNTHNKNNSNNEDEYKTLTFNIQNDETLKLNASRKARNTNPLLDKYVDQFDQENFDEFEIQSNLPITTDNLKQIHEYSQGIKNTEITVSPSRLSTYSEDEKSNQNDELENETDLTEFLDGFDNIDEFEKLDFLKMVDGFDSDLELPKSLKLNIDRNFCDVGEIDSEIDSETTSDLDNDIEFMEDFKNENDLDFFSILNLNNKEKFKNLHKNLVIKNETILTKDGFLHKKNNTQKSSSLRNNIVVSNLNAPKNVRPSKLPRSVKSSYNLNAKNEFKYKKFNSTNNLADIDTKEYEDVNEVFIRNNKSTLKNPFTNEHASNIQNTKKFNSKVGLLKNLNKDIGTMKYNMMKYNPNTFKWEGNYCDLDKFSSINTIYKKQKHQKKKGNRHNKEPSLISYKDHTNATKVGNMIFDSKNLKWIYEKQDSGKEEDPFRGIVDLKVDDFAANFKDNGQFSNGTAIGDSNNYGSENGLKNYKTGEFKIGSEFKLSQDLIESFQKEETKWIRKVGNWFEPIDNGAARNNEQLFNRDFYYELFDMVNGV